MVGYLVFTVLICNLPIYGSAQAHSTDEILWGRFLVGLGIGVNTVLVPVYTSEVSIKLVKC